MTEADIGMTEHRSKNTLGRSAPIKTKTDVEEDGTSEDGSPRPVCIIVFNMCYERIISTVIGLMGRKFGFKNQVCKCLLSN